MALLYANNTERNKTKCAKKIIRDRSSAAPYKYNPIAKNWNAVLALTTKVTAVSFEKL